MPPLRLTSLLQTALPELSSASRAVVSTLGCLNGNAPSARDMAVWVGLRDRYQLARVLRRDGLPPLEQLAGWTRVLYWMLEAETSGASLRQLAQRERVDPAVAYRLVHRVTGLPWSQAQRAGLSLALLRFRERRGMRLVPARTPAHELHPPLAQAVGDDVMSGSSRTAAPRMNLARAATARPPGHPAAVLGERIPVGGGPFDVTMTPGGIVLVTRVKAAAIDLLSLQPLGIIGSVRTGPAPSRVVVDSAGTTAYVTNQFAEEIGIIDLGTRRQSGTIPVQGHPLGVALAPDGRTLYTMTNVDRLCAVSIPKARVVTSVPVPCTGPNIAVHPSGRRLYVPCWRAGVVVEIDAHTLCLLRRFEVGGIVQDLALTRDGQTVYAANEGGWLNTIHLPTGRVTTLELGHRALGLALSPDEQVLFVGLVFDGRVIVIDRGTLTVRATLPVGGRPREITFDRTGRTAVIANEAGWVDVVH
jgi:YVTN family beta-propeller protein